MQDERIAFDEARRLQQHGAVKNEAESRVGAEIRASARAGADEDQPRIEALAQRLRSKAIDNVAETDAEIERQRRFARIRQFVDYAFGLVYGLLGLRFALALVGARQGAGFTRMVNTLSAPFYEPFRGILPAPTSEQGFALSGSVLIALVAFVLLHLSVKGLLRIIGRRSTEL